MSRAGELIATEMQFPAITVESFRLNIDRSISALLVAKTSLYHLIKGVGPCPRLGRQGKRGLGRWALGMKGGTGMGSGAQHAPCPCAGKDWGRVWMGVLSSVLDAPGTGTGHWHRALAWGIVVTRPPQNTSKHQNTTKHACLYF